jgi:hypothetical protein
MLIEKQDVLHAGPNGLNEKLLKTPKKMLAGLGKKRDVNDDDNVAAKTRPPPKDKTRMRAGPNAELRGSAMQSDKRRKSSEREKTRRLKERSVGACVGSKRPQLPQSKRKKRLVELRNVIVDDLGRPKFPRIGAIVRPEEPPELQRRKMASSEEASNLLTNITNNESLVAAKRGSNRQLGHTLEPRRGLRSTRMHHLRPSTAKQLTRTADKPKMIQHDVKHVELSIDRSTETMHQKNPKNDDGDEQDEKNASAVSVTKIAIETGVQKVAMNDITAVGRQMLSTQQLLEQVGGRRLSDKRYRVRSER